MRVYKVNEIQSLITSKQQPRKGILLGSKGIGVGRLKQWTKNLSYFFPVNSFWYAFQPGHHRVCQRQNFAKNEYGFCSALVRILQFSQFELISNPPI